MTPTLVQATAVTQNQWGEVHHQMWFDSVALLGRWDRVGPLWNATLNAVNLITNYSTAAPFFAEYVSTHNIARCGTRFLFNLSS